MRPRSFQLWVDSGSSEEPSTRYFGSLEAAISAMEAYPESYREVSWIGEMLPNNPVPIVHVKDGKRVLAK